MALKPSGEMYLETIYMLSKTKPAVRAVDIAEEMNFSKPSVSRAVGILKNENYITIDRNGAIVLTQDGYSLACKIYERHTVLTKALTLLGVDEKVASDDACKIEHVISDQSLDAIKKYIYGK